MMGGANAIVESVKNATSTTDLRWAAQVLDHVVFAEPDHRRARALLADTLEKLGFGIECGTWRSAYLSGAQELRTGNFGTPTVAASQDMLDQLTPEMFFDALAVQIEGPKAWDLDLAIGWIFVDNDDQYFRTTLKNGVFTHVRAGSGSADLTLYIPTSALGNLAVGDIAGATADGMIMKGEEAILGLLFGVLQPGDPDFNIILP